MEFTEGPYSGFVASDCTEPQSPSLKLTTVEDCEEMDVNSISADIVQSTAESLESKTLYPVAVNTVENTVSSENSYARVSEKISSAESDVLETITLRPVAALRETEILKEFLKKLFLQGSEKKKVYTVTSEEGSYQVTIERNEDIGISSEEVEVRNDLVSVLKDNIESMPDGTPKQTGGRTSSTLTTVDRIDTPSEAWMRSGYFKQTKEHKMRTMKLREALDKIAEGLDALDDKARAILISMAEEIDTLSPDTKVSSESETSGSHLSEYELIALDAQPHDLDEDPMEQGEREIRRIRMVIIMSVVAFISFWTMMTGYVTYWHGSGHVDLQDCTGGPGAA